MVTLAFPAGNGYAPAVIHRNPEPFKVGNLYSHQSIMGVLKVGNSGGVRVAKRGKSEIARVVLFSTSEHDANPQENPYQDHAEGAILTYTGTGKIGDQNLSGPNARITQQAAGFFPIYVFTLYRHRKAAGSPDERWRFSGIYKYLDHSRQNQTDLLRTDRNAWVFRLLRLDLNESHPAIEAVTISRIAAAYADPALTAQALLEPITRFPAVEIEREIHRMNALAPVEFEIFLKHTLIASHFREVRVTRQSSDNGIDIVARLPLSVWPIETQTIQVQAKRWQRPVGRREVAQLRGSLIPRAIGVIITTGNYARTAIIEADRPNLLPISLIDGHKLACVTLGLKAHPYATAGTV